MGDFWANKWQSPPTHLEAQPPAVCPPAVHTGRLDKAVELVNVPIPLHVHSDYSLLDGLSSIAQIVAAGHANGMTHLAITDHGTMAAAIPFARAARKAGIVPIIGSEMYLAPLGRHDRSADKRAHITLLAADEEGYHTLVRLSSRATLEGYYYKPRIDLDLLAQENAGLICLSGCLSGIVAEPIAHGRPAEGEANALKLRSIFGNRFYLEIMRHGIPEEDVVLQGLAVLSKKHQIPLVATPDSHYPTPNDATAHKVLLCVGTHSTLQKPAFAFDGTGYHIPTADEFRATFADVPHAVDETLRIAERCSDPIPKTRFAFPRPLNQEEGVSDDEALRRRAVAGVARRYGPRNTDPVVQQRLAHELDVIKKTGFAGYFLVVADLIALARSHDIPIGPGRGSAVGSLVAYALHITNLCPLEHGLLFERFLTEDRISPPDIDTDVCQERRNELLTLIEQRYGKDRITRIATYGSMQAKNAIRDAGRVLETPLPIVNQLCSIVADTDNLDDVDPEKLSPGQLTLLRHAQSIVGRKRHASIHPAGIVIAPQPVWTMVPLQRLKDGTIASHYEMNEVEESGLPKMDLLGLRNLSVIKRAVDEIRKTQPSFCIDDIPTDDAATYKTIASGQTTGIFQFESEGMRALLSSIVPTNLADLTAAVAIYRPGPLDWANTFIARKHGREPTPSLHPELDHILASTYSIAIYQEQIMALSREMAGFDATKADAFRKALAKKQPETVAAMRNAFIEGAIAKGFPRNLAERVFAFVEPFAGYGFNRSHAAAYAYLAYQTAYLRTHYPIAFLAALLASTVEAPDRRIIYLTAATKDGIRLLPPHIDRSSIYDAPEGGAIRIGLRGVHGVGQAAAQAIAEGRVGGPFRDLPELVERLSGLPQRVPALTSLARVGALDHLGAREAIVAVLPEMPAYVDRLAAARTTLSLFADAPPPPAPPKDLTFDRTQRLRDERELLGVAISGHLLDGRGKDLANRFGIVAIAKARDSKRRISVAGVTQSLMRTRTRDETPVVKGILDDPTGALAFVAYGPNHPILNGSAYVMRGTISMPAESEKLPLLHVDDIAPIEPDLKPTHTRSADDSCVTSPAPDFAFAEPTLGLFGHAGTAAAGPPRRDARRPAAAIQVTSA